MLHVVVVGGGPAGLIAAEAAARAGIRTTLIERAPERVYPCTGPLTSTFLDEFQVPELLLAQRLREVALYSPTQRTAFITLNNAERWTATMRRDLLQALFKRRAEEAGVTFLHGTFMRFRHGEGDYPQLEVKLPNGTREQVHADVVIGADGVHSRVARSLGLSPLELGVGYQERFTLPAGVTMPDGMQVHFGRKVSTDTYGWVTPQGEHLLVGVATASRYGRRLWGMLAELKKRLGNQLDGAKSQGFEAFCYPQRQRPKLAHDRVLLVGDAAGLMVPGLMDGLYYACRSGQLAAETVIRHQHVPVPERLTEYESSWRAAYAAVFAGAARLEQTFFGADREREALIDLAWDREAQRLAVDAYLAKKRFAAPFGTKLRIKARQVSQLVKYRVINPKRLETDLVSRALPAAENYLDLALKTPSHGLPGTPGPAEIATTVPEASSAPAQVELHGG